MRYSLSHGASEAEVEERRSRCPSREWLALKVSSEAMVFAFYVHLIVYRATPRFTLRLPTSAHISSPSLKFVPSCQGHNSVRIVATGDILCTSQVLVLREVRQSLSLGVARTHHVLEGLVRRRIVGILGAFMT